MATEPLNPDHAGVMYKPTLRTFNEPESLSALDSKTFVAAILEESDPVTRLRKAAQRYKKATA